jgi:hypothetical protein
MGARRPRPPELGPSGARFWRSVTGCYELSPAELETLRQACHTCDLIEWAQVELESAPLTVPGSSGQQVSHPLIASLNDLRRVLDQQLVSLSLPMPDEVEGRRRSPAAVRAAQQRWRDQRKEA